MVTKAKIVFSGSDKIKFNHVDLLNVHESLADLQERISDAEREATEAADRASEAAVSLQYVEDELRGIRFFLLNRDHPEKRGPVTTFTENLEDSRGPDTVTGDPNANVDELYSAHIKEFYGPDWAA